MKYKEVHLVLVELHQRIFLSQKHQLSLQPHNSYVQCLATNDVTHINTTRSGLTHQTYEI
jgi:hypothetical protein